jgi:hypothetical protein
MNDLQKLGKGRPVWMSEWCSRREDTSPGQMNAATEYGMAMHEIFTGGANVFMATTGLSAAQGARHWCISIGQRLRLKKPYWVFRQWAEPLTPGMRIVDATVNGPGPLIRDNPA